MELYKQKFIDFSIKNGILKSNQSGGFSLRLSDLEKTGDRLVDIGSAYAESIRKNFGANFDMILSVNNSDLSLAIPTTMQLSNLFHHGIRYCEHHIVGSKMTGEIPKNRDRIVIVADSTVSEEQISGAITQLKALALVKIIGVIKCFGSVEIMGLNTCSIISEIDIIEHLKELRSRLKKLK